MSETRNLDSVFADCTEAELGFEAMFDEDDSIIDHIAGVDEAGVPLTGPDFDWDSLTEADEALEDKDDAEQREGKSTPDKEGMEGTSSKKPEIGGEVGDGKEVSGKENSAESNAHDVTKDIEDAIGTTDKQQTSLKEDSAEGPLEDDDEAEREGKVSDTSVETEGACADGECDGEATEVEDEKCQKESSAPDLSDAGDDVSISEGIIAKIKDKRTAKKAAKKEASKELEDGNDEEDDADVEEVKNSKKDKEAVKEAHMMNIINAKRAQVNEAKEQAITDELLEQVLNEMTEEELNNDNVLEVAKLAVSKLRAQCEAAADTLTDQDDADQRDGKASVDNKNIEGVKSDVIGDSIKGSANSDEIADKCDTGKRDGKITGDTTDVEGVSTKVVGAALESDLNIDDLMSSDDELIDLVIDDDEKVVPDSVKEASEEKSGEKLVADIAPEVDDEDIDLIKNNKAEDDDEGVEVEYSYEDDELIDIAINDDEE